MFRPGVCPPHHSSSSLQAAALDIAMIKMVAPSMASRVIDRAIQVSTDDGSLVLLNHSQDSEFLSFSCPTPYKLITALCCTPPIHDCPFPPQVQPCEGSYFCFHFEYMEAEAQESDLSKVTQLARS